MGTSKAKRRLPPSDQFPGLAKRAKPKPSHLENRQVSSESSRYEIPDRKLASYPTYTYKLGVEFRPEHRNVVAIVNIDRGRVTIAYDVVDQIQNVAVE